MVQWIRSPTRTLSGVTDTVTPETAPDAPAEKRGTIIIGSAASSNKSSHFGEPDLCPSHLPFTIPEKRVEVADKGSVCIEKYRIDSHPAETLPKLFMQP